MAKFDYLNTPDQWNQYFTKYPQGYTILEALLNWVQQVNDMTDNVNSWNEYLDDFVESFDTELQQTVTNTLTEWQNDGTLNLIINTAVQTGLQTLQIQLDGKRDISKKIASSDLDISSESAKIQLSNLSEAVKQTMSGETPINTVPADLSVTRAKVVNAAIDYTKIFMFEATVQTQDGITVDYSTMSVTIKKGTYWTYNWQTLSAQVDTTLTLPNTSRVMFLLYNVTTQTFSIKENNVIPADDDILLLCIYNGGIFGKNASACKLIKTSTDLTKVKTIQQVVNDVLLDDFKQYVNVKILGDSITAGSGSTGYGTTTDLIGSTGKYKPLTTSLGYANLVCNELTTQLSRPTLISPFDRRITTNSPKQERSAVGTVLDTNAYTSVINATWDFDFEGTDFSMYITKNTGGCIFEVWVDGLLKTTIDLYDTVETFSNKFPITGLSNMKHHVQLKVTSKQAASVSYRLNLEAIEINKQVTAKNYGVSGQYSKWIYDNRADLVEADDDIILLQIGTNDRLYFTEPGGTRQFLSMFIEYLITNNKEIILISPPPSSTTEEAGKTTFHLKDVNRAYGEVAQYFQTQIISNYNALQDYCYYRNVSLDSLLADGLHPNDTGHQILYKNVMKSLGLTV